MINFQPLVSIIIPCYNNQEYIEESINSAFEQDYPNIEVIVVNDGSKDESINLIKKYSNRLKIVDQKNQGASSARNNGLKIANGEYIKFLDGDDILHPNSIREQVAQSYLHKDDQAIVYGIAGEMDKSGIEKRIPNQPPIDKAINQVVFFLSNNYIVTSCPLHKKAFLDEFGSFDENLSQGEDPELHLRLCLNGVKFIYYPTIVYYRRQYSSETRLSSIKWPISNPDLGMMQLSKYEYQILSSTFSNDINVMIAIGNKHFAYARMFARCNNMTFAHKHIAKAFQFIKWHQLMIERRKILGWVYYFFYVTLGLRLTEKAYYALRTEFAPLLKSWKMN